MGTLSCGRISTALLERLDRHGPRVQLDRLVPLGRRGRLVPRDQRGPQGLRVVGLASPSGSGLKANK